MEASPEVKAEGIAVCRVLAAVLERLVGANRQLAIQDPGQVTKFHAMKAPGISVVQYLERIHKYAACSNECFVLALIYIDRLIQRNNFLLTDLNVHRVVITAVLLAAKFFDDAYYNNAYYAKVGGVLVSEMNGLEVDFLFRINFSLHITPEVFDKYRAELMMHSAPTPQAEPHQQQMIIASDAMTQDVPSQPLSHIMVGAPPMQQQPDYLSVVAAAAALAPPQQPPICPPSLLATAPVVQAPAPMSTIPGTAQFTQHHVQQPLDAAAAAAATTTDLLRFANQITPSPPIEAGRMYDDYTSLANAATATQQQGAALNYGVPTSAAAPAPTIAAVGPPEFPSYQAAMQQQIQHPNHQSLLPIERANSLPVQAMTTTPAAAAPSYFAANTSATTTSLPIHPPSAHCFPPKSSFSAPPFPAPSVGGYEDPSLAILLDHQLLALQQGVGVTPATTSTGASSSSSGFMDHHDHRHTVGGSVGGHPNTTAYLHQPTLYAGQMLGAGAGM